MRPRALALATAPALLAQAQRVRRRIPRLPEAAGPRTGDARPTPASPNPAAPDSPDPDTSTAPLSLLVIGESTAVGVGAATQEEALAAHIARALAHGSRRRVELGLLHVRTPFPGSGPMQAIDRFHPSALGYELWGDHLAREILGRWTVAGAARHLD